MILTFLGHQSWLVSCGDTHILIDPILKDSFGSDDDNGIEIYPPRFIDIESMPRISGIILSHEHSDHFHIPSLKYFPNIPIFFGSLMPQCVQKTIEDHDLKSQIIPFFTTITLDEIEFKLYPADSETVLWESRVTQILLTDSRNPEDSVFIAVDALVSNEFKNDLNNNIITKPTAIILSNNSQLTPKGVLGSLDNFKNIDNSKAGMDGLSLLHEMLVSYLIDIEDIKHIVICGGGFTKKYDTQFGPFLLSDQQELAQIANNIILQDSKIYGPLPGEVIEIYSQNVLMKTSAPWIKLNKDRLTQILDQAVIFASRNDQSVQIRPVLTTQIVSEINLIENELNKMAKALMISKIGGDAIFELSNNEKLLSPYGLLINFSLDQYLNNWRTYGLNFNKGKFEEIKHDSLSAPYGLDMFWNDFLGLIAGEIQIWDLGGIAIRSWYPDNSKMNSPVAFLYSYFGEQLHNQLNYICYQKRWLK